MNVGSDRGRRLPMITAAFSLVRIRTDNSLDISHLSEQIYTDNNTERVPWLPQHTTPVLILDTKTLWTISAYNRPV